MGKGGSREPPFLVSPAPPAGCPGPGVGRHTADEDGVAGYATLGLSVTKTGGLTITAGSPGAESVNGQAVTVDFFTTNVKP